MTQAAKKKETPYGWGGHICDKDSPDCNEREKGDVVSVKGRNSPTDIRPGIVLGHSYSNQWVVLVGTLKLLCQQGQRQSYIYPPVMVMDAVHEWHPSFSQVGSWELRGL